MKNDDFFMYPNKMRVIYIYRLKNILNFDILKTKFII